MSSLLVNDNFCQDDDSDSDDDFWNPKSETDSKVVFHKWFDLVAELKAMVITKLDLPTKTRLSYCSTVDYDVVESTPIILKNIEIDETEETERFISRSPITNVSVVFDIEQSPNNMVQKKLYFIKKGNDTEMAWVITNSYDEPERKSVMLIGRDYLSESWKFAERMIKRSNYKLKSLTSTLNHWPIENSKIQFLNQCHTLQVYSENDTTLKWWLSKVHPSLDLLYIQNTSKESPSSEILSMEHFQKSSELTLYGPMHFNDEQFLKMTANKIVFESDIVTDGAINQFIDNWQTGKLNDHFLMMKIVTSRSFKIETLLKSTNARPWEKDFEKEAERFCHEWRNYFGRHVAYQIFKKDDSGDSCTLDISKTQILFMKSGSGVSRNGKMEYEYGAVATY